MMDWLAGRGNVATLIDIGANDGAFAAYLVRELRPRATWAVEPLPACRKSLEGRADMIPNLTVIPVALSDETGTSTLYINDYLPASSLLQISGISRREFPQTAHESAIEIPVRRFDDVVSVENLEKEIFIKIDVQDLKDRVIASGRRLFEAAKYVLIEVSFAVMHENQPLFEEVHADLADLGFRFAGLRNQVNSKATGQPLFGHALYVRPD